MTFIFNYFEGIVILISISLLFVSYLNLYLVIVFVLVAIKLKYIFKPISSRWNTGQRLSFLQNIFFGCIYDFANTVFGYNITSVSTHKTDIDDKLKPANSSKTLIIGYHSRQTIDLLFFMVTYQTKAIIHDLLCDIPGIGDFFQHIGAISSKSRLYNNHAENRFITHLLTDSTPLLLLPGGAYECLKYTHEENQLLWKVIPGFTKIITKHIHELQGLQIIPMYTQNCEDLFIPLSPMHDFVSYNARLLTDKIRTGHYYMIPYAFTILITSLLFLCIPTGYKVTSYMDIPIIIDDEYIQRIDEIVKMIHKQKKIYDETPHNDDVNADTIHMVSDRWDKCYYGNTKNEYSNNKNGKVDNNTQDSLQHNTNNVYTFNDKEIQEIITLDFTDNDIKAYYIASDIKFRLQSLINSVSKQPKQNHIYTILSSVFPFFKCTNSIYNTDASSSEDSKLVDGANFYETNVYSNIYRLFKIMLYTSILIVQNLFVFLFFILFSWIIYFPIALIWFICHQYIFSNNSIKKHKNKDS